ncbi:unnamed protein product [Adineta ricciae]|uniref:Uncharacterized protein n=1 Tax=Adineta ricciae TaxID=249248 RepID=A0A814V8Q4_ADIRI|nr:unnamed protein product [Adineta ricciae]
MDSYKTLVRNLKAPYFAANLYWDRAKLKKLRRVPRFNPLWHELYVSEDISQINATTDESTLQFLQMSSNSNPNYSVKKQSRN